MRDGAVSDEHLSLNSTCIHLFSVTVIENEQRQLLYRESRGKDDCGIKTPSEKHIKEKECVLK